MAENSPDSDTYPVTERTKLKRMKHMGKYDQKTVHSILDEALIAHVAFVKNGTPMNLPMTYGRKGETLFLHGSITNAMLKAAKGEVDVCVTVTLLDGIVVARSAYLSGFNYRSVVIVGKAHAVTDPDEKWDALNIITEHVLPGRTSEARTNTKSELNATLVLAIDLVEVSAKVRTGGPKDNEEDYMLTDVWAGVLPVAPLQTLEPIPDTRLLPGIPTAESVTNYRRPTSHQHTL